MRLVAAVALVAFTRAALGEPLPPPPPPPPDADTTLPLPPPPPPPAELPPSAGMQLSATPLTRERCDSSVYLEPSLLFGPEPIKTLHRMALGVLIRGCDAAGLSQTHVRLGATAYVSEYGGGLGAEAEYDRRLTPDLRAGVHFTIESSSKYQGGLMTFGGRLHVSDTVYLSLEGFRVDSQEIEMTNGGPVYGVLAGGGVEGRGGAILGGIELGLVAIGALLVLDALSHDH